MSAEEFRLIRDLVYERCGISIRDDLKFVMERRLWPRLETLALRDFERVDRGETLSARYRVRPEIRSMVSFGALNLLEFDLGQLVARQDAIFCRNVLIYFDLPARRRVLELFYARLVEGGYLLLG